MKFAVTSLSKLFNRLDSRRPERLNRKLIGIARMWDMDWIYDRKKFWRQMRGCLKGGADIDARDENGRTALSLLCEKGSSSSTKDAAAGLIDAGASLELKDDKGMTPLMYAAKDQNAEMTRLLLSKGANLNAEDKQGRNAMSIFLRDANHVANQSMDGDYRARTFEALMEYGAEPPAEEERIIAGSPSYEPWEARVRQQRKEREAALADTTVHEKVKLMHPIHLLHRTDRPAP